MNGSETTRRLTALRRLLAEGQLGTQDELREELARLKFVVNQSTISRDLRRVGAIKGVDTDGRTIYRLPEEVAPPSTKSSLEEMIIDVRANNSLIVIITTPGSASLIARHLDHARPGGILGTIAGDDTIFVAPPANKTIAQVLKAVQESWV